MYVDYLEMGSTLKRKSLIPSKFIPYIPLLSREAKTFLTVASLESVCIPLKRFFCCFSLKSVLLAHNWVLVRMALIRAFVASTRDIAFYANMGNCLFNYPSYSPLSRAIEESW